MRRKSPTRGLLGDGGALAGGHTSGLGWGLGSKLGSQPSVHPPSTPPTQPPRRRLCSPYTSSCSPREQKRCDHRIISATGALPAFTQAGGEARQRGQPSPLPTPSSTQGPGCVNPSPRERRPQDEAAAARTTRRLKILRCSL